MLRKLANWIQGRRDRERQQAAELLTMEISDLRYTMRRLGLAGDDITLRQNEDMGRVIRLAGANPPLRDMHRAIALCRKIRRELENTND